MLDTDRQADETGGGTASNALLFGQLRMSGGGRVND